MSSRVPNGRSPHASHASPSSLRCRAELGEVRVEVGDELAIVDDRPRRELELAAGLDRELRVAARERDHVAVLERRACRRAARTTSNSAPMPCGPSYGGASPVARSTPISSCSVPTRHALARLAGVAKYASSSLDRADRNRIMFVDEVHAGSGHSRG